MKLVISHDFKNGDLRDPEVLLSRIASYQIAAIRRRTQEMSVDADERPFKPYSRKYLRRRQKNQLSSKVNLTVTGRMMQSLRVIRRTATMMEIGLTGEAARIAGYHIDTKNPNRLRDFMGFSRTDEREIDKIIDQWVEEELQRKL
jgi:phage gpG-like protein